MRKPYEALRISHGEFGLVGIIVPTTTRYLLLVLSVLYGDSASKVGGTGRSTSIERDWAESDDQSGFGWTFRERGSGVESGPEARIAAGPMIREQEMVGWRRSSLSTTSACLRRSIRKLKNGAVA